ncbi:MAG: TorF family putative porin [Stenotrophobium sp.]
MLTVPASAFAEGWGGSLGATTDYVFRGVSQSDGKPSVQADGHYYGSSGWFAGLWAASVRSDADSSNSAELNGYLGYAWPVTDAWSAKLTAVQYAYTGGNSQRRYDYDELAGTLAYTNRVFLTAAASPNTSVDLTRGTFTHRAAFSYDLAVHQPLGYAISANTGVGYYDLHRLLRTGYVYWNAGLSYDYGAAQFDVSYIGTNAAAKSLFYGDAAENRWVASVLWHF